MRNLDNLRRYRFRYKLGNGATGTGVIWVAKGADVETAIRTRYHLTGDAELWDIKEASS